MSLSPTITKATRSSAIWPSTSWAPSIIGRTTPRATACSFGARSSLDGGKTWESEDIAILKHPTEPGVPWEDKPYVVADDSQGPYAGNLYVGWTRWTLTDSEILLSRSTDDGKTWSPPLEIDAHRGLPRDDNGALEGFSGAVGPDSTLYAVWADGDHIVLTSSRDGGRAFEPPRNIITVAPIMFHIQGTSRANGFPVVALDPRTGRLYVAWSDYRNGDVDVFCSTSSDGGQTWADAVRVNSDPLHDGADQFFHWLAVDPATGDVDLIFYDRRGDPGNKKATVTLARSADGGQSFVNYAWTEKASFWETTQAWPRGAGASTAHGRKSRPTQSRAIRSCAWEPQILKPLDRRAQNKGFAGEVRSLKGQAPNSRPARVGRKRRPFSNDAL